MTATIHFTCGPRMVEAKRQPWEERWCFRCRKRQKHDAVLMVQDPETEPSYLGDPFWKVECHGCGGDHVRFPGTEDGPTLQTIWDD